MGGMPRFADMFVPEESDPRPEPPTRGDERATLVGFLAWQRETLVLKCTGLSPEDLARRSVDFANLSLLGLVRHLADVERGWFRRIMAGEDAPRIFHSPDADTDFDGSVADPVVVEEAWTAWRAEVDYASRFVTEAPSLDVVSKVPGDERGPFSLRWVLTHLIEEYARHLGHADLLRQGIDGAVGQ
jgi:uncharacterized damage-inducible protein DinB